MKLIIDISDTDIPKSQDMLEIDIMFIDGHISQCTYPCEILKREPIEVLQEIRQEIAESKYNHRGEYNRELVFNICLQIIDKKIKELSE